LKRTRARDSSSIFFISKWVIIVAIVIVSSLSFTLGYYVGKRDHPPNNNQSFILPTDNSMVENDTVPADEDVAPPDLEQTHDVRSPEAPQPSQEPLNTHQTNQITEAKGNQVSQQREKTQPPRTKTANITYTVQTGAFKSAREASTLKEKLDKKGYTAYIIQSETKKHERLYKVMIGEFRTRKEAEVLSLKIKKAEGLQAFVTFRTQEDLLR
jgi:cell division septation protein DedD